MKRAQSSLNGLLFHSWQVLPLGMPSTCHPVASSYSLYALTTMCVVLSTATCAQGA